MNEATFQAGMRLLADAWPEYPLKPGTVEAYRMALDDLHETTFQAAVAGVLRECKFFPKPAEIRAKAVEVLSASGMLPPEGEMAWARLIGYRRFWSPDNGWCAPCRLGDDGHIVWGEVGGPNGYYGAPSPLDAMTERAVQAAGGLERVYGATDHDLGFIRREFLEFYGQKRQQEIAYGPALLGQPVSRRALAEGEAA